MLISFTSFARSPARPPAVVCANCAEQERHSGWCGMYNQAAMSSSSSSSSSFYFSTVLLRRVAPHKSLHKFLVRKQKGIDLHSIPVSSSCVKNDVFYLFYLFISFPSSSRPTDVEASRIGWDRQRMHEKGLYLRLPPLPPI